MGRNRAIPEEAQFSLSKKKLFKSQNDWRTILRIGFFRVCLANGFVHLNKQMKLNFCQNQNEKNQFVLPHREVVQTYEG